MIVSSGSKSVNQTSSQLITDWVTSYVYTANDYVRYVTNTQLYVCLTGHTSGTFNTDLGTGKWALVNNQNLNIAIALAMG